MVSTSEKKYIRIDAGEQDTSRPSERPPKSNWKIEILKKGVSVLQLIAPGKASKVIWQHFTKPGRSGFTPNQKLLLEAAEVGSVKYKGDDIVTYKWGTGAKKILLSHGWNSKTADFRRIIERLVAEGYTVEGVDMRGHGKSGGERTAVPEMREILKNYYIKNGPYHAVIGYSIGGMVAGIVTSELSKEFQPDKLFVIAAPSYVRYFFKDTIKSLGYSEKVYQKMTELIKKHYHESIDYFDLRKKRQHLRDIEIHLIYDENDETVPFIRGEEMKASFPDASFVHTKGLGHYKVITYDDVVNYLAERMN